MAQFDVFENPVRAARSTYPFVIAMQLDLAATPAQQLVAPVTAHGRFATGGGRLTPKVEINGNAHAVLVSQMTVVRTRDLVVPAGSLVSARDPLLAAIEFLFFGL